MILDNTYEIGGFVAAIALGIIAYFVSKKDYKAIAVFAVTGLCTCVALLLSIRFSVIPSIIYQQPYMFEISKNDDALSLSRLFLDADKNVNSAKNPFFENNFNNTYDEYKKSLEIAKKGQFIVDKKDIGHFSNQLIKSAQKYFFATSYVDTSEWWETQWGKQYEQDNYDLIKNGVEITRFFIFSNNEEFEKALKMIKRQMAGGINIFIVNTEEADYRLLYDVIVIDDVICGELELTPDKKIVSSIMSTNPKDIARIKNMLENLKYKSTQAKYLVK